MSAVEVHSASLLSDEELATLFTVAYQGYLVPFAVDRTRSASSPRRSTSIVRHPASRRGAATASGWRTSASAAARHPAGAALTEIGGRVDLRQHEMALAL